MISEDIFNKAIQYKSLKKLWLLEAPELQAFFHCFSLLKANHLEPLLRPPVAIDRAGPDRVEPGG